VPAERNGASSAAVGAFPRQLIRAFWITILAPTDLENRKDPFLPFVTWKFEY
jgi:hypothetical protein